MIAGDLVADQFLSGTIARVSREAPVFILRHDETDTRPGAAANTAANVASLGGDAVLVGVVGDDTNGGLLCASLPATVDTTSGVLTLPGVQTTTKVRVLAAQHYAARQQVIRIDYEGSRTLDDGTRTALNEKLVSAADGAHAIVLSDYGYGVVDDALFETARRIASEMQIPLIVDSRSRLSEFVGATSATPNQEEVEHVLGKTFTDVDCERLREKLGLDALLITRGNKGMLLLERNRPSVSIDAVGSSEPVDVTGAGDTVIAAYALALASGLDYPEAALIANHAGGIVVMKKGTATVTLEELNLSLATDTGSRKAQVLPAID